MKKIFTFAAVAAVVLSSCAKVDNYKVSAPEAISFGVYAGNAANTKAVSGTDFGTVTTASLQNSDKGFGVFAYYTDDNDYDQTDDATKVKANFMYNQQVKYDASANAGAGAWSYSPVKYWPNEHGASAVSTDTDKLTFLAYAPFVANFQIGTDEGVSIADKDGTADATEGIIAMTANDKAEDATLTFKVPASSVEQIDLMYGVLGATYVDVEGTTIGTVGDPMENLTKQKTDGKISILFKHALAKIAIDIKEVVDAEDPTTTVSPVSDGTKVVVKSVTLKGSNIGTQGKLNLYTGAWSDFTNATEFSVAPLPAAISVDAAPTAYPSIAGVDEDGLGLGNTIDLMLIPSASSKITGVEIVYYVCTEDTQLDGGVSVVENKISKDFTSPLAIAMGKQYGLNLLLGLTSIELTAEVEPWDVITPATDVDLPQNVD